MKTLKDTIGNTPLVYLEKYSEKYNAKILVKLESRNPGGSVKDRVALKMIEAALHEGKISTNGTIIEATSGNTGIGLAMVGRVFGLKTVLVMPESLSIERRKLLAAYGADLVLTPASEGISGSVKKAHELLQSTENAYMPDQFSNPQCILAHYEHTAPEIHNSLIDNKLELDLFLSGVGSGGTISGVGRYFKEKVENVSIFAVEPSTSAVLSGKEVGSHGIQGIGAGFIPNNFDSAVVDDILTVSTEDAIFHAKELMQNEGISCGISTGANIAALVHLLQNNSAYHNKTIVTLVPDSIDKYLSTALAEQ